MFAGAGAGGVADSGEREPLRALCGGGGHASWVIWICALILLPCTGTACSPQRHTLGSVPKNGMLSSMSDYDRPSVRSMLANVLGLGSLVSVLYAIGLFGWQWVTLLRFGSWIPIPCTVLVADNARLIKSYSHIREAAMIDGRDADLLPAFTALWDYIPAQIFEWPWFNSPTSWFGLHAAVSWLLSQVSVPASAAIAAYALAIAAAGVAPSEKCH